MINCGGNDWFDRSGQAISRWEFERSVAREGGEPFISLYSVTDRVEAGLKLTHELAVPSVTQSLVCRVVDILADKLYRSIPHTEMSPTTVPGFEGLAGVPRIGAIAGVGCSDWSFPIAVHGEVNRSGSGDPQGVVMQPAHRRVVTTIGTDFSHQNRVGQSICNFLELTGVTLFRNDS